MSETVKTNINYRDFKVDNLQNNDASIIKLTPIPSRDAFQIIDKLTEQFHKKYCLSEDFIQQLQVRLNSEAIIYESEIILSDNSSVVEKIKGKHCCNFVNTCIQQNIAMIWHDKDKNTIRLWGDKDNLLTSINVIKHRIKLCQ